MEDEGCLYRDIETSGVSGAEPGSVFRGWGKRQEEGESDSLGTAEEKIQFYSQSGINRVESSTRQIYQRDYPDTMSVYPSQTQSPDTRQVYNRQTQSPDTREVYPSRSQSPETTQCYPSQTQSPDTCQTSQVSSSVSESLLYRQSGKTASQDSNWDINDPDIPARIEQHVSSCLGYLYYTSARLKHCVSSCLCYFY